MDDLSAGPGAPLKFDISDDADGCPVVTVEGELDLTNADVLDSRLAPWLARSPKRLVVDTTGLEFADSSAIALLLKWANVVPELELRNPPELLRRVIVRMGLAERLRMTS